MTTDWLSAIGILLAGLIVGFMFVYASMRKKQETSDDLDRRDLEAKRDALIAQLRADDLAPNERTRIEREAADVLRALDQNGAPPSAGPAIPAKAGAPPVAKSSAVAGFLWGAGSVAALVLIAWFATKSSTPKETPPQQPQSIEQLESTVRSNPDDTES